MLRRTLFSRRTLALTSGSTVVVAAGGYYYLNSGPTYPPSTKETRRPPPPWTPPSRVQMLDSLKASSSKAEDGYPEEFDLLIVGGGATGAGVAADAASRGLKVALVERGDFSSGTCVPLLGARIGGPLAFIKTSYALVSPLGSVSRRASDFPAGLML